MKRGNDQQRNTEQNEEQDKISGGETLRLYLRTLKLIWKYYPGDLISNALYFMMQALSPYVPLYFSARFLDELAGRRRQDELIKWVLLLLILSFITTLATHLLGCWEKIGRHVFFWEHQSDFYSRKLLEADFEKVDDATILDRLTQIEEHQRFMGHGMNKFRIHLEKIWKALFQIAGGIFLSCSLFILPLGEQYRRNETIQTGLMTILLLIVLSVFLPVLFSRVERRNVAEYARAGATSNRVFLTYGMDLFSIRSNALDIRTYRQDIFGDRMLQKHGKSATKYTNDILNKGFAGLLRAVGEASSYIMMGFIYLYVCLKAWFGAFGIGSVTQYVGAVNSVANGISTLVKTAAQARTNASFLKKIFDFLDMPNEMYQGSLTVEKRKDRNYEVEFQDVSFRYPNAAEYALRHVNMKFTVGSRLAVVGQNGSGKTTFIKLLCRLYDPTEGVILLNGFDIRKYDYREYISIFSVVFQDFSLTGLPLGQNVAAAMDYDKALAKSCLEKAGFGQRLENLPQGLDTYLDKGMSQEGVDMSGGERQKIALARAIYKEAPFIVLDEPTAALDPMAEAEIYSSFNNIIEDKTAIYISHRLSSCKFCDDILVFDKGSIIQHGSHDYLLADKKGKYHELWQAQAQYYNDQAKDASANIPDILGT